MTEIRESSHIKDVKIVQLKAFGDERGRFMETFRKEWFPERSWDVIQTNRSHSTPNVLRGLHYHFHQVDYWHVVSGAIRAALVDIRPNSPTFGIAEMVEMDGENHSGLFIPVGVAHGFVALTPVILSYVVDNYYNGADELGVAWDDPELAVPWGVAAPLISERDLTNPLLRDIPREMLPTRQGVIAELV